MLTPNQYWWLFNDPGLSPPVANPSPLVVSIEVFLGLTHQVQALVGMIHAIIPHILQLAQPTTFLQPNNQQQWVSHASLREDLAPPRVDPTALVDPPKNRSDVPIATPRGSATHPQETTRTPQEPDTLSSDSTDSLRTQLRQGVLPMLLDRDNAPQEASNLTMTIDPREPSKLILNPEPMEEVGEIPVDPK
ncbi:hypothetical protein BHE74_00037826 [Ensete ventricosum]|nr:hypothetical protein BHE74_00037826 [Ensete ventricosum]